LFTAYYSAVKLKLSNEFVKILKNEITKKDLTKL
ncbi:sporulation histidine kinase inhibitor Sda, partial [Niallia circulans]